MYLTIGEFSLQINFPFHRNGYEYQRVNVLKYVLEMSFSFYAGK
jgi:hypothetical protein